MFATRIAKTFTLERDLLKSIEQSKGKSSSSERVNELLKIGLEAERRRSLEQEAADFFTAQDRNRAERLAFQSASMKSLSRE